MTKNFRILILFFLLGCGERSGLIQESFDPGGYDGQSDPTVYVTYSQFVIDPTLKYFSQTYFLSGSNKEWSGDFQYLFDLTKLTYTLFKANEKKQEGFFTCLERIRESCTKFEFDHFGFWNKKTIFKIEKIYVESVDSGETFIVPFVKGTWPNTLVAEISKSEVELVSMAYSWSDINLRSISYKGLNVPIHGSLPNPNYVYKSTCHWIQEQPLVSELKCYFTDSFSGQIEERRWLISIEL